MTGVQTCALPILTIIIIKSLNNSDNFIIIVIIIVKNLNSPGGNMSTAVSDNNLFIIHSFSS